LILRWKLFRMSFGFGTERRAYGQPLGRSADGRRSLRYNDQVEARSQGLAWRRETWKRQLQQRGYTLGCPEGVLEIAQCYTIGLLGSKSGASGFILSPAGAIAATPVHKGHFSRSPPLAVFPQRILEK
jgi:hypothetical protein